MKTHGESEHHRHLTGDHYEPAVMMREDGRRMGDGRWVKSRRWRWRWRWGRDEVGRRRFRQSRLTSSGQQQEPPPLVGRVTEGQVQGRCRARALALGGTNDNDESRFQRLGFGGAGERHGGT